MPLCLPPVVALLLGLVHCIAGYRLFPLVLGVYGLVLALGVAAALAQAWFPGQVLASSLMQGGAGLLGLGIVLAYFRVGIFLIGAVASVLLTQALAPLVDGITWPVHFMIACVAGSATVVVSRIVLIAATAITGALMVVRSVEAIVEGPARWLINASSPPWTGSLPDECEGMVAWAFLALIGMLVQQLSTRQTQRHC